MIVQDIRHRATGDATNVWLLSPHCDDIAFSIGSTVSVLAHRPELQLTLVTIFSLSHYAPMLACDSIAGVTIVRKFEDCAFVNALGGPVNIRWLDCEDAPLRGYGLSEICSGVCQETQDREARKHLRLHLLDIVKRTGAIIICPIGVGSHVDHVLVRREVLALVKEKIIAPISVGFYEELPYSAESARHENALNTLKSELIESNLSVYPSFQPSNARQKDELISTYASQLTEIDRDAILRYNHDLMENERIWFLEANNSPYV